MPVGRHAPRRLPRSHRRDFVQHHTRLQDVAGVPGIRLHLAEAVEPLWHAVEETLGVDGVPIPFWAFAWAGGLGVTQWLQANPEAVAGLNVLDFGTGSGIVAIAAAQAGARHVLAVDVDPFAEVAVELNAKANRVHLTVAVRDLLDERPPAVDVLLAADTWYESPLADRVLPWLLQAADDGTRVIVGDPGRMYLPDVTGAGFVQLASYSVATTTTLEDRAVVDSYVFELRPTGRTIVA